MASFGAVQSFAAILAEARSIDGSPLFFFAFAGLMLLTRPVFGRITDRRGYRLPMLLGISFVTAGLIVLSFAQSLTLLLTSAVMIGIGFGAANPATQTMAVADVSPTRRGIATATYFVGFDGGIGVGSVIGGLLAQGLGYGQMFQIVAVLPVVALLVFLLTEKSFTPKSSKPTDTSPR
jgi:MFS family permease